MDITLDDEIARVNLLMDLTNEGVTEDLLVNITGSLAIIANELKPLMTQQQYHKLSKSFKHLRKLHTLRDHIH